MERLSPGKLYLKEYRKTIALRAPSLIGVGVASVIGASGLIPESLQPPQPFVPSDPRINPMAIWGAENEGFLMPSLAAYKTMIVEDKKPRPVARPVPALLPEVRNEKSSATLSSVLQAMEKSRNIIGFQEHDFTSLKMYWEIYQAAAKKYGIDWRILFTLHDKETMYSFMKETAIEREVRDFDENGKVIRRNILYGAMQRDKLSHPDKEVEEANKGMEYLSNIPVRVPKSDANEIVWAAKFFARLLKETKGDLLEAFARYSARTPAVKRWQNHNLYLTYLPK